jgi:FlaG/FlaF family flagellin (archaellin)
MVAITVVLAAVLYVMVMGFGGEGGQTPSGSFTVATKESATTEKLQFAAFEPSTAITELKFNVIATGANAGTETLVGANSIPTATLVIGTVTFVDLGADGFISAGDYLLFDMTGSTTGTTNYEVTIVFADNGDMIDDIAFNWVV